MAEFQPFWTKASGPKSAQDTLSEGCYIHWIQLDTDPRRRLYPIAGYRLDTDFSLTKCCNNHGYRLDTDWIQEILLTDTAGASGLDTGLDIGYRTPLRMFNSAVRASFIEAVRMVDDMLTANTPAAGA